MLKTTQRQQLIELAETHWTESRSEHHTENEDECIGCRKMKLALNIFKFVEDFSQELEGS